MATPAKRVPLSIDQIVAKATRTEKVISLCVSGALQADYEGLQKQAVAAHDPMQATLGNPNGPAATRILKQLEALEKEMAEATFQFRFRALSARQWAALLAEYPDPKGEKLFNLDTFPNAAIAASCVDPEGMNDSTKVEALMDQLSAAQQADLFDAAWEVNTSSPKGRNFFTGSAGA